MKFLRKNFTQHIKTMHKWITEKFTLPFREQLLKFPYFLAFLPPCKNNFPNYLISWKLENHTIYRWPNGFSHHQKGVGQECFFALISLRSKRFQSSYCAKVRAGASFFLLSSQFSRWTRAETLATQASLNWFISSPLPAWWTLHSCASYLARFASTLWTMLRISTLKLLRGAVCGRDNSFLKHFTYSSDFY